MKRLAWLWVAMALAGEAWGFGITDSGDINTKYSILAIQFFRDCDASKPVNSACPNDWKITYGWMDIGKAITDTYPEICNNKAFADYRLSSGKETFHPFNNQTLSIDDDFLTNEGVKSYYSTAWMPLNDNNLPCMDFDKNYFIKGVQARLLSVINSPNGQFLPFADQGVDVNFRSSQIRSYRQYFLVPRKVKNP